MRRFEVTVAGELNLDLILYGLPEELPRDRELLARGMTLTLGSSSAIVAHNLAALGNRVGFISRIGDDQLGQIALDLLAASGVLSGDASACFSSSGLRGRFSCARRCTALQTMRNRIAGHHCLIGKIMARFQ